MAIGDSRIVPVRSLDGVVKRGVSPYPKGRSLAPLETVSASCCKNNLCVSLMVYSSFVGFTFGMNDSSRYVDRSVVKEWDVDFADRIPPPFPRFPFPATPDGPRCEVEASGGDSRPEFDIIALLRKQRTVNFVFPILLRGTSVFSLDTQDDLRSMIRT